MFLELDPNFMILSVEKPVASVVFFGVGLQDHNAAFAQTTSVINFLAFLGKF